MALVDGAAYEQAMAKAEKLQILVDVQAGEIDRERALADELAAVLAVFIPVVQLYLDAFDRDELMTLYEKLRLQDVEGAFEKAVPLLTRHKEARR